MNNKGFTLVELLAVLVILTVIMSIALPSISSSMERSKDKQDDARKKIIIAASELYVTDNKNVLYRRNEGACQISFETLIQGGYLTHDEIMKSNNKEELQGWIEFNKNDYTIKYCDASSCTKVAECNL